MNSRLKYVALVSVLSLAAMTLPGEAAKRPFEASKCIDNQPCADQAPLPGKQRRVRGPDAENWQQKTRRHDQAEDNGGFNRKKRRANNFDDNDMKRQRAGSGWHYDPSRHHRYHNRTTTFRYEYGGYWYAQPYWTGAMAYDLDDDYGISCREGRDIVDQRFNRVRIVECNGRAFTYLGRRNGNPYRVSVSSSSGNIISVRPF